MTNTLASLKFAAPGTWFNRPNFAFQRGWWASASACIYWVHGPSLGPCNPATGNPSTPNMKDKKMILRNFQAMPSTGGVFEIRDWESQDLRFSVYVSRNTPINISFGTRGVDIGRGPYFIINTNRIQAMITYDLE